jgi:hypothetical protein
MNWAQAIRDICVTFLVVCGVLGFFTDTLEVLVHGWPKDVGVKQETENERGNR